MSDANYGDVTARFAFYPASTEEKKQLHEAIRDEHRKLAGWLMETLPDSRERSLALTALQESMMWSNACAAYQIRQF